jgi:hypothetical protein
MPGLALVITAASLGLFVCEVHADLVVASTGEQVVESVTKWGIEGGNTQLLLVSSGDRASTEVSMQGVPFVTPDVVAAKASRLARLPYSSGQLTISGAPPSIEAAPMQHSVLDAAMRSDLLPQFDAVASLHLANFTMVRNMGMLCLLLGGGQGMGRSTL